MREKFCTLGFVMKTGLILLVIFNGKASGQIGKAAAAGARLGKR